MKSLHHIARLAPLASIVALASMPQHAHAHGTVPTSNAIDFGSGSRVLLGTNFGGVVLTPDGEQHFICELAMTGFQQSVATWVWLDTGEVLGIVTGGFTRGVVASDPSACVYGAVPGTDEYLLTDLTQDPTDGRTYYATGDDDDTAVLLFGIPSAAPAILYSDSAVPLATASGVRAGGSHVYAVFTRPGVATLVHNDGVVTKTTEHALAAGETLRPLGVSLATPTTVWLTRGGEAGDTLMRSEDGGVTLVSVLTVDARLGGFAIDGTTVWVQSARGGVQRSDDDGKTFVALAGSPKGTCLAVAPDHRLYACGVPWQDGFALGVSDDGRAFSAVMPYYDSIVGAVDCAVGDTTSTCNGELEFLRGYYGFSDPAVVEPGPEATPDTTPEPEVSEPVEAQEIVEAESDISEPEVSAPAPKPPADGGCAAGASTSLLALLGLHIARRKRS